MIGLTASAVFSQHIPRWVLDKEAAFPPARYISASGEAATQKEAEARAVSSISLFFNAKTGITNSVINEYNQALSGAGTLEFSKKNHVRENMKITSQEEFLGVRFAPPWNDPARNVWMVLAYIEKSEAARLYESKIRANLDLVEQLYRDAQTETPLASVILLAEARKIGALVRQQIGIASMVDPSPAK
jgi:hypothetical protein